MDLITGFQDCLWVAEISCGSPTPKAGTCRGALAGGLGRRGSKPAHSLGSLLLSDLCFWAKPAKPRTWGSFYDQEILTFYKSVQTISVLNKYCWITLNELPKLPIRDWVQCGRNSCTEQRPNVSASMNNALSSWVSTWNMKPQQWAHQGFTGKYVHSRPPEPHNGFCSVAMGGEGGKVGGCIQGNNVYCLSQGLNN